MPSNKLRTVIAIVLVAAAVIGGHLLPGLDNSRVDDGIRNGLHVLVFAVVAIFICKSLKHAGLSVLFAAMLTVFLVAGIGGSAEFLQYLSGRQPDLLDVIRDLAGAALALIAFSVWDWSRDRKPGVTKVFVRSLSIVVGVWIFVPLGFWLSVMLLGLMSAPVIVDFEQWWNKHTYRPVNAEINSQVGATGFADIGLQKRGRSGLVISPMLTDWSSFEFLSITAGMIAGPDTNVTVRINDSDRRNNWSDQFLASIIVESNVRKTRIPLRDLANETGHAPVNLSDIQELVIFARDRRSDTVMRVEDIRLE